MERLITLSDLQKHPELIQMGVSLNQHFDMERYEQYHTNEIPPVAQKVVYQTIPIPTVPIPIQKVEEIKKALIPKKVEELKKTLPKKPDATKKKILIPKKMQEKKKTVLPKKVNTKKAAPKKPGKKK